MEVVETKNIKYSVEDLRTMFEKKHKMKIEEENFKVSKVGIRIIIPVN